jgi:plasmid stabilization system protein ParE
MSNVGHRIHITDDALSDLRGIFDYIEQHSHIGEPLPSISAAADPG